MKILLCGTYPNLSTGYSKVVSQMCKHLGKLEDVELFVYGIHKGEVDVRDTATYGPRVTLHDVVAHEKKPSDGFGMYELAEYVKKVDPDIVLMYNDLYVMTHWYAQIKDVMQGRKLVLYLDLFYKNFYTHYLPFLGTADLIFVFSDYWQKYLVDELKITSRVEILYHGFSRETFFKLDTVECREKFGFHKDAFIILNLNRNLPRKRIDIFMMAVALLIKNNPDENILVLQNSNKEMAFDVFDILRNEFAGYGMGVDEINKHLEKVKLNTTSLPDADINALYNACNVGINTCSGEGWGLCNFEAIPLGKPQIATNVGGMADFISNDFSIKLEPVSQIYLDRQTSDAIGGKARVVSHVHAADAMEFYLKNPSIRELHGQRGMEAIKDNPKYHWDNICKFLYDTLKSLAS